MFYSSLLIFNYFSSINKFSSFLSVVMWHWLISEGLCRVKQVVEERSREGGAGHEFKGWATCCSCDENILNLKKSSSYSSLHLNCFCSWCFSSLVSRGGVCPQISDDSEGQSPTPSGVPRIPEVPVPPSAGIQRLFYWSFYGCWLFLAGGCCCWFPAGWGWEVDKVASNEAAEPRCFSL